MTSAVLARSLRARTGQGFCVPGMLVLLILSGCSAGNNPGTGASTGTPPVVTASPQVTAWGDSLTAGNEDGTGITYPRQLATLTGKTVNNMGIGGQTSSQIAVRMNAYAGQEQQTFASAFIIPISGTVEVTFQKGFEPCYNVANKQIYAAGGVPIQFSAGGNTWAGTCADNGSHDYIFTPTTYPTAPVTVMAGTAWSTNQNIASLNSGCAAIWAGRNNYTEPAQVQTDVAAMVAAVEKSTGCYLVMSIPNGEYPFEWKGTTGYNTIIALNDALSATYSQGNHYLDIRTSMVSLYNPSNPADVLDHNNDVWPYSLRAQDVSGALTTPLDSLTSCAFSTSEALSEGQIITLNAELIQITGGTNGAYTCVRGYAGSTAATYASASAFTGVDPLHLGQNAESALNPKYTNGYDAVAAQVFAWLQANAGQ
jgi:hypothetical protein